MGFLDFLGFGKKRERINEYLEKGAVIVDVRSQAEFNGGHANGSINVPMESVQHKMNKLKKLNKPLILCCATGRRSGLIMNAIKAEGIDCMNAGSWRSI